jgi:excisionase family DNA binding protein
MSMLLEIPDFTVREAAKYLGVSRDHVYKQLKDGRMRGSLDITGQLRVPYDELLYQIRRQEEGCGYGRG